MYKKVSPRIQKETKVDDTIVPKDTHGHIDKLSTIEYLIAGATHEINNSLSAVIPKMKLVESHLGKMIAIFQQYKTISKSKDFDEFSSKVKNLREDDEKLAENCITKIKNYISINLEILDNVQRITESMRNLKFLSNHALEKFEINELLTKVLTLLDHLFEKKKIEISTDWFNQDMVLTGSSGEFTQAMLNLLINAIHALEQKKSNNPDFSPKISIRTFKNNDYFQVQIKDNGTGVEHSIKDKLFCAFTTTKPKDKGTGLGLSIVKRIVDNFKGKIEFESKVNEYTKFIIKFPIKQVIEKNGRSS
ncbi:HAMP domain-containing histidine kinase [bacterium]|nr:HAMP domain-containing histidine kinase [bacterium]